jgi:hypothetical protein
MMRENRRRDDHASEDGSCDHGGDEMSHLTVSGGRVTSFLGAL